MSHRWLSIAALALGGVAPAAPPDSALPPGASLRLGDTRFRAGGEVAELSFSADGAELTSRGPDGAGGVRVIVWDAATGTPVRTTTEPRPPGARVRWATTAIPDTSRGVVVGPDGVAVVRDFAVGKDVVRLTGHFARVTAVTVSADGARLATASADGLIRVWDAETFRPLLEARGHAAAVRAVEVSPDGRTALSTGADGTARVWDLATGRELRAFPVAGAAPAAFTPDGAAVRLPTCERAVVRDLVTGLEVLSSGERSEHEFPFARWALRATGLCVAVSPDGRTVAVGGLTGTIDLYEAATGRVRRHLVGPGVACLDLSFTPDGGRLLTARADHAVLAWPVRLRDAPLSPGLKRETNAARLWDRLADADAEKSYSAMARLAADPAAAVAMARRKIRPVVDTRATEKGAVGNLWAYGAPGEPPQGMRDTDKERINTRAYRLQENAATVADARAVELLEAVGTPAARALLRDVANGDPEAARTRMAQAAVARSDGPRYHPGTVRTTSGTNP